MSAAATTTAAVAATVAPPLPPVPPILSLLDRPTLRLLAAWSPALLSPPSSSVPVQPSSLASDLSPQSATLAVTAPFPPVNLPLLATRAGLTQPAARAALDFARAHDLILPDGALNPHAKDLLDSRNHRLTAFARRRRLLANRANAAKSTGPRSELGKSIAALNGLKHGLTAQLPVLPTESELHYLALHRALHDEYQPANPTELLLLDQLAHLAWRLRRAHLAEAELNHHTRDHEARPGIALLQACESHLLPKLDRHLAALTRAFTRTLHELQELQGARHNAQSDNDIGQGGFALQNDKSTPPDLGDTSLLAFAPDLPPRAPAPTGALTDLLTPTPDRPSPVPTVAQPPSVPSVPVPSVPEPRIPHPAPRSPAVSVPQSAQSA